MRLSQEGINLLSELEGVRLYPYHDQTGEPIERWVIGATIGVGHLIGRSEWEANADSYLSGLAMEEVDELLRSDLRLYEKFLNRDIVTYFGKKSQTQYDALIIFMFNVGIRNYEESSVRKILRGDLVDSNYPELKSAWMAWNKSQGKKMAGLVTRRRREFNLYTNGEY